MRAARAMINPQALLHNLKCVKALAPKAGVVAMVKANAYGHHLMTVAQTLSGRVASFGVASLDEALALRAYGVTDEILLMEGLFSSEHYDIAIEKKLSLVIHHQQQLGHLLATPLPKQVKVWLKVDTGMNRLGFKAAEFKAAYEALKQCPWVHTSLTLMTHFPCANEKDKRLTYQQLATFKQLTKNYPEAKSAANSATICSQPSASFDYVRPGLMLYGASPVDGISAKTLNLRAVMTLCSEVIAIKVCEKGDGVGYGHQFVASKKMRLAVVAMGYGDGFPCHLLTNACVVVDGKRAPIVGRVSMDMLTLDVTELPLVTIGSHVELWGEQLPIDEVAAFSNTTAYDLFCRAPLRAHYS